MLVSDGEQRPRLNKKERAKLRARAWLREYLRTHPCVDCGEADFRVLEFDHIDPRNKIANVGRLACNGCSIERVAAEVLKCEVRCANCHRLRTIEQRHASFRRWRDITVYDSGG